MAVYEYECLGCGYVSEHVHAINVLLRNTWCPCCNQWARVRRLISKSTFILKGPGWAKDGYRK
jgi:putative FmdB family regulatory protein